MTPKLHNMPSVVSPPATININDKFILLLVVGVVT
jgi:hypothetical protein